MRIAFAFAATLLMVGHAFASDPQNSRPAYWAQPVELKGVPNLYRITNNLYRSAQPSAEGMRNLKRMGIKTIINLRAFHSDRDEIGKTGLQYEHIFMKTWHPEKEDVVRFLRIVTDPKQSPVLVHCQHGADRTGTMSAIYRVVIEGWTKEEAVREMTHGGFNFHEVWSNLPPWIAKLDVSEIRKELDLKSNDSN
ncbi:MAG: dual specificity protein phosphatase family protein [Acidiferrobacterales bacterium]